MTRRSSRRSPKPPQRSPPNTRTGGVHLRGNPPKSVETASIPVDLKADIVTNWKLPSDNINACVPPDRWPLNEPDPEKWPVDIIHLLHQASEHSKGDNTLFQLELSTEIASRQTKNKSVKGKADHMTLTDLKKVCKRLESITPEENATEEKAKQKEVVTRPIRRGRSNGKHQDGTQPKSIQDAQGKQHAQEQKPTTRQGRADTKQSGVNGQEATKPPPKRQPSDLPIRPARKPRTIKSPKSKSAAPPPVTPANPPEASDEEEDEEQENAPPEPVSGRHIYGTYIKPSTVDFNPEDTTAAQAKPRRQTRKRARAEEEEKPPVEVQIDSDPRDIDATGFLSELDPKEARRRRKPRLSRLQQEPVAEPAWSQDVPVLKSPVPTPAAEGGVGTPAAAAGVDLNGETSYGEVGLERLLKEVLPGIPENATSEERSMLEDRVALLLRDVVAYKTSVWEIEERAKRI